MSYCKSVMQVEELHITNSLRCSITEHDLKSHIAGLLRGHLQRLSKEWKLRSKRQERLWLELKWQS